MREALTRRWDRQMSTLSAPQAADLGRKPEKTAREYADKISLALRWHTEMWSRCKADLDKAGIDWQRLANKVPAQKSSHGEILRIREILVSQLPALIATRKEFVDWQGSLQRRG